MHFSSKIESNAATFLVVFLMQCFLVPADDGEGRDGIDHTHQPHPPFTTGL